MPFYEYECSACKFYVEALQKVSDPPMKKCPSCKKQTLKKLVSAPAFRLAGSGWYETDFKSDKENKRNLVGDDQGSGAAETKTETADSKPAADAKSDSKSDSKSEGGGKDDSAAVKKSTAKAKSKSGPKLRPKAKPPTKKK